ncbi:hypothetical protein HD597_007663 [Nonomuraea thailandensis]|uniref:Uncharacterized protein n=1 Tax=Nonomuraea thailandensis TaxID=1188745 RepID=A0A9X2GUG9_9ACTN|nr:hypothetical protein [Nonomuraea thailandensis]
MRDSSVIVTRAKRSRGKKSGIARQERALRSDHLPDGAPGLGVPRIEEEMCRSC